MKLPFVLVVVAAALSLSSCSSAGRNYCSKAKECCAQLSRCDEVNREGPGYEDRCDIGYTATLDALATYDNAACGNLSTAYEEYIDCISGVACADVSATDPDRGHVAMCDAQAMSLCNARGASGDACGHDYGKINCSQTIAQLSVDPF